MNIDRLKNIKRIDKVKPQDFNLPILPVIALNPLKPKANIYRALWNTGSNACCVSEKVIEELELKPVKQGVVSTANKNTFQHVYNAHFLFQKDHYKDDVIVENIEVTAFQSAFRPFDIIIGTNIFSLGKTSFEIKDNALKFNFQFK